ncbi:GAF and ANTAR domain-containing protein [Williamsia deligens]
MTDYALGVIPGAEHAGITVATANHVTTPAATTDFPVTLDDIQREHRQGPCLTAAAGALLVEVTDLETETRWPLYRVDALARTPIRSILSLQLFSSTRTRAALNVYSGTPHAFTPAARDIGMTFATHTAMVWDAARRQEQFERALASRDIIGQSKGMLMERFDIDSQQAFDMLRELSQDTNTLVVDVAQRLVDIDHPAQS